MSKIIVTKESLSTIVSVVLGSEHLYQAKGNTIAEVDTDVLTAKLVKAVEAQAKFDESSAEPKFDPSSSPLS